MDFTDLSSSSSSSSSSAITTHSISSDSFTYPTDESGSFAGTPAKSPKRTLLSRLGMTHDHKIEDHDDDQDMEIDLMKERFSKLLLGEDMSGSGKGVTIAVAISNSITNLYVSVFGQHQKLEPLHPEKKMIWKREMNCFLSVCDYIVEFYPIKQTRRDGSFFEVKGSRPRSDIQINLPALRKLNSMLLDILETFVETEFWYVDEGSTTTTLSGSFRKLTQRNDNKWWLPVPCVPSGGLSEKSKKHLRFKRDSANQIHKAAMAINNTVLSEMEIPATYISSLPKSGKTSAGEIIYRFISSTDKFSPDHLLNNLNITSEHEALEIADRVEASMYVWRRKSNINHPKSSWDFLMKDLIISDTERSDKNHMMSERALSFLFCLKQRYPELSQTSLDACKIQFNRDIGQAILESYSRVLEGLAFNIVAWIDDVLFVDKKIVETRK
ncbi:rop guanine nucleotide exchange factor 3-like [Impatiens glandulifera]|uniref:rop guanine nucleotide exchange factor 3-like n=1 Tax=Impatiens glandulifera TaxID=253017 RepID=UPI001FB16638|nr:rop guanine nucleotide exchange factor 3-like [Impatiens glandulifera]